MFLYKRPDRYIVLPGIAHLGVSKLKVLYPPSAHWVANCQTVYEKWESYLRVYEKPDKRQPRHPLHLLDPSKIAKRIPTDLSCYLYDIDTGELVAVVIRKFCSIKAIKDWVCKIIYECAIARRSIRLEDPGSLIQVGFSGGSRTAPTFGMVRNFLSKADPAALSSLNRKIASLFAYMWLRVQALFPEDVVKDFEGFYNKWNTPRFDPDWPDAYAREASIELPISNGGDARVTLQDVESGPGLGVLSQGYARLRKGVAL